MEHKTEKSYPSSVLRLYTKIYLKRRTDMNQRPKSKNNMTDAMKSWLSLSEEERNTFKKKYDDCKFKRTKRLAAFIKKTQPFLKKKPVYKECLMSNSIAKQDTITLCDNKDQSKNEIELEIVENEQVQSFNVNEVKSTREDRNASMTDTPLDKKNYADDTFNTQTIAERLFNNTSEDQAVSKNMTDPIDELTNLASYEKLAEPASIERLIEPAPVSVRTGRELFEMINSSACESEKNWTGLSNIEKRRYTSAVTVLKNTYLQKYQAYLESLPFKELFNYYNNFFTT